MDAELSEGLFKSYLDLLGLRHERHVCVHGDKNVDFHVDGETPVLCDVKEIRPSPTDPDQIDAYSHLREDLRDLRKKFGPSKPVVPVLLVTMNFSGRLFTGFSVARAMLGGWFACALIVITTLRTSFLQGPIFMFAYFVVGLLTPPLLAAGMLEVVLGTYASFMSPDRAASFPPRLHFIAALSIVTCVGAYVVLSALPK